MMRRLGIVLIIIGLAGFLVASSQRSSYDSLEGQFKAVVSNFEAEWNGFYRNVGSAVFEDLSGPSGFGPPAFNFSGFGLNLFDAANAGRLDAFIANGHVSEAPTMQGVTYAERPFLMWNDGKGK